ncbi:MAG: DUF2243 domain-containing protein [Thermomicrobiales bacterium]
MTARTTDARPSPKRTTARTSRLTLAGVLLGLGLGGFFDGIVLHQVLQWHHMLTSTGDHPVNTVAGLETNTLWDGFFHLSTYALTIAGLVVLMTELSDRRHCASWSTRTFAGNILIGWGLFNLVEGVIDHHLLGIHHVRSDVGNQLLWDLGFLAWGALMVIGDTS